MILPIVLQTVLGFNSGRKSNIMDFCNAYFKCEQFDIMTFLSKNERQCIEESVSELSTSIQNFAARTNTFNLEIMGEELFKNRPSELPYVITFLEYSLYSSMISKTFSAEKFVVDVGDIFYRHSNFYPMKRYCIVICMFLYFLDLL